MAETKYGKYIVTQPKLGRTSEHPPGVRTEMAYLDSKVIPGAIYTESFWYQKPTSISPAPHTHDFDEVVAFYGSDPENPQDLNGEVEFWLDDEPHLLTKSCLLFIPKGMKHCPYEYPARGPPNLSLFHGKFYQLRAFGRLLKSQGVIKNRKGLYSSHGISTCPFVRCRSAHS